MSFWQTNHHVTRSLIIVTLLSISLLICWAYAPLHIPLLFGKQILLIETNGNNAMNPYALNTGIVLFAYNSEDKKLCLKYLKEANQLCINLLSKNSNQSLNIALFTIEKYYNEYKHHHHFPQCAFDKILFLDQLDSNQNLSELKYIRFAWDKGREWFKRILLFQYSPYYITMALDADMYPCHPFKDIMYLFHQMETKNIDFAYTSFQRYKYPQNGLFLYRKNNRTRYLFENWYKYHTTNKIFNDQPSLNATITNVLNKVNIYLLNNRYNVRGFGFNTKLHNQLLYPHNKIMMFHRRAYIGKNAEKVCETLNKYPNTLSMAYDDGRVRNCFKDKNPKCLDYYKYHNSNFNEEIYEHYKFFWSDSYICEWNESVDFVAYDSDTCT